MSTSNVASELLGPSFERGSSESYDFRKGFFHSLAVPYVGTVVQGDAPACLVSRARRTSVTAEVTGSASR